jgi:hypothetical protein
VTWKLWKFYKRNPIDISLSDARERMRELLDSDKADVSTTVTVPGAVPIVTVKPLYQPVISPTRVELIAGLDKLRREAIKIEDEELSAALDACYRLVTEGRLTLVRVIREEKEEVERRGA